MTGSGRATRALNVAFALFAIAGLTGALYRGVVAWGWDTGLDPVNIRHAHSHLMYFGWVTPALFVLIGGYAAARGARPVPGRLMAWTLGLALTTAAAFLPWGYQPALVGHAHIPITIILSTACMVAWYFWLAWYRTARASLSREPSRALLDAAAWFLGLSTLGAWSVAAVVPFGAEAADLKLVFAHLFLQYFAEGWFVLGLVGIAWSRLERPVPVPAWALSMSVAGIVFSFLLTLPESLVESRLQLVARMAGLAHGIGTVGLAWTWWRNAPSALRGTWGLPLLILAAKGATQAGAVLVPGIWWAELVPVRILYLHVMLLGFVSLAIGAEALRGAWLRGFQAACFLVVISLVPFTQLWPFEPPGMAGLQGAAWVSFGPPIVALAALLGGRVRPAARIP